MSQPLCLLLVEDSVTDAESVLLELRLGGYDPIYERVDTSEAMKAALAKRAWEIVISDYALPGFSGLEALRIVQETGIDVPFFIVASQVSEETAVEAMKAGADDYVLKANLTRLVPAIQRELRAAQVRRERERVEQELRTANALFRQFVQNVPAGVAMFDTQMRYLFHSKRWLAQLGMGDVDVIGRVHYEVHPDLPERWKEAHRQGLAGAIVRRDEDPYPRADGTVDWTRWEIQPWRNSQGKIGGIIIFGEVITDEVLARQKIEDLAELAQRKAAELEGILNNMVEGVYVGDSERRLTTANASGMRMLGFTKLEDIARALADFPDLLQLRHLDGTPMTTEELPLARALDGETLIDADLIAQHLQTRRDVYLRVSAAPIRDERGAIIGAVAVARDVSDLTELDRLKDEFISVAAHELKTPVTIMKGNAQALLRTGEAIPPPNRRMLDAIDRGADRIDRIVRDLLDISQMLLGRLELSKESVNLTELVESIVNRFALTTTRHRLKLASAQPVVVQGDRDRLEQVVANLTDNAIRYSPQGGAIDVAVKVQDRDAVVSVKDRGVGIPKERQQHIFERFYRAHTGTPFDYGGMGVGLFISNEIVSRHGGKMWFESEESKGSTFYFSLPL